MMWFLIEMREAAMERHRILVEFWYPAGPERVLAMAQHKDIVRNVYWVLGD
jgi:hypothetical protein